MKNEKPILFSGPMVRAILEGRKTQTRRTLQVQPPVWAEAATYSDDGWGVGVERKNHWCFNDSGFLNSFLADCKHGNPGDRLWVKETFRLNVPAHEGQTGYPIYRADFSNPSAGLWKPSIFMPRWASRITLEITAVRVERLQDISETDAKAEGVSVINGVNYHNYVDEKACWARAYHSYMTLWESINGAGSWDANPWVWVIEFRKI